MNILTDKLAQSVIIDGAEYPINTDYRTWIKIDLLLTDRKSEPIKALTQAIILCYKKLPSDLKKAVLAMLEFYRGEDSLAKAGERKSKAVYNFEYDSKYIYSSFLSQYGIDLTECDMHWHKFKALFSSFGDDVMFVKIMQYRSIDLGKIKDKEQKKFYRKMKRIYALPDNRSDDEKEKDIIAGLEML